jgi:UDP-N-acetylglucosamine/UDP-N-acetylgalactosamine diphosphorylase
MNSRLLTRLKQFDQQHLLRHLDKLDEDGRQSLTEQIAAIDFQQIAGLFAGFGKTAKWAEMARRARPPVALRLNDESANPVPREQAVTQGEQALSAGQIGMILVAGGQGSRLGFHHPKGLLPLGPVSGRTLFQIHIDRLQAINARYGCTVPLYVMTSPATHEETGDFLKRNRWFGYPPQAARIFCQGTMPAVDATTGHLLLAAKDRLFASPDGHGGMLAALQRSGSLRDMQARRLQQIFYCQIDNPLAQVCDPATLGYHILTESEMSSQAVPKTDPLQKVGNIVAIDGKVQIIEYSDLPDDVARQTEADGSLTLWAGNIAVHVFDVEFLDRMTEHADALPFHLAHKKVPFIDDDGHLVQPDQPNAIKFERFIFDLLPMARHSIVVEVEPAEAFSPVKNAATESTSTAFTAQQSMIAQARRRLQAIGVEVDEGVAVELDPQLMLDSRQLRDATAGVTRIQEPLYLRSRSH